MKMYSGFGSDIFIRLPKNTGATMLRWKSGHNIPDFAIFRFLINEKKSIFFYLHNYTFYVPNFKSQWLQKYITDQLQNLTGSSFSYPFNVPMFQIESFFLFFYRNESTAEKTLKSGFGFSLEIFRVVLKLFFGLVLIFFPSENLI